MKKNKIAVILATEPSFGGAHQYAMLIAKYLVSCMGSQHDLIAICYNSYWFKWCRENKVHCINIKFPAFSKLKGNFNYVFPLLAKLYNTYFTSIGKVLRQEKVDILFSVQQLMFIPNYKVKIVMPVHDLMHKYEGSFPEVQTEFEQREIILKCLARYGRCVLTDSILGKKQFVESYSKYSSKNIRIITLPFIVPDHVKLMKEEYINVPAKYIFYPAQFWKHKNHINLLKAIKILKREIKNIHLVLVGSDKNALEEIEKYINDNNLKDNVTIIGFVSDGNITYLYKHAVGLIMPSYFGPTNIPPLEAMTLGCPVMVSNRYAMPEQVGKAGLLFDPDSPKEMADCIRKVWNDKRLCEKMRRFGYNRVGKWTKEKFESKLHKIINLI